MNVGMQDRLTGILPDVYPNIESCHLAISELYFSFHLIEESIGSINFRLKQFKPI